MDIFLRWCKGIECNSENWSTLGHWTIRQNACGAHCTHVCFTWPSHPYQPSWKHAEIHWSYSKQNRDESSIPECGQYFGVTTTLYAFVNDMSVSRLRVSQTRCPLFVSRQSNQSFTWSPRYKKQYDLMICIITDKRVEIVERACHQLWSTQVFGKTPSGWRAWYSNKHYHLPWKDCKEPLGCGKIILFDSDDDLMLIFISIWIDS